MGKKLLIMILMGAFCVSACGNDKQAKNNYVNVSSDVQSQQAISAKLDELKQLSAATYHEANLNTQVVEKREREKAVLRNLLVQVEAEADAKFATHKQNLEDTYQLKLFNLRVQLESLRLRPDARAKLEEEIAAVRCERELKLQELAQQRQAYINKQMQLYQNKAQN